MFLYTRMGVVMFDVANSVIDLRSGGSIANFSATVYILFSIAFVKSCFTFLIVLLSNGILFLGDHILEMPWLTLRGRWASMPSMYSFTDPQKGHRTTAMIIERDNIQMPSLPCAMDPRMLPSGTPQYLVRLAFLKSSPLSTHLHSEDTRPNIPDLLLRSAQFTPNPLVFVLVFQSRAKTLLFQGFSFGALAFSPAEVALGPGHTLPEVVQYR